MDPSGENVVRENTLEENVTGIRLDAKGGQTIEKNIIRGNRLGLQVLQAADNQADLITANDFFGNWEFAVENAGSCDPATPTASLVVPVKAEGNWWGHASGPTHGSNPTGQGDRVSDDVDFDPWLTAPVPFK